MWRRKLAMAMAAAMMMMMMLSLEVRADDKAENDIGTLIVGGSPANPTRYPYYSYLFFEMPGGDGSICGGTLIHEDIVLTAAHCEVVGFISLQVVVNQTNGVNDTGFEYYRTATTLVPHPRYNNETEENDVMILLLDSPVTEVNPVTYNTDSSLPVDGAELAIFGFGDTMSDGESPDVLLETTVNVVSFATCSDIYGEGSIFDNLMVCAGAMGRDTCQGDSGGPAVLAGSDASQDVQVGITSFGDGCGQANVPGVYARVSNYQEFIETQICTLSVNPPPSCPSTSMPVMPSTPMPTPSTPMPTPFTPMPVTTMLTQTPTVTDTPTTTPTVTGIPTVTATPSMMPTPGRFNICFSEKTTVLTKDRGIVSMRDLRVGDMVRVASDNDVRFASVYAFGHRHETARGDFLRITTEATSFELSPDHLVFLADRRAIPASKIREDDALLMASGEATTVRRIQTVTRQGLYAPFTTTGTIVVNGDVVASSYVSIENMGVLWVPNEHWLAHVLVTPFRLAWRLTNVQYEQYTPEGLSRSLWLQMKLTAWFVGRGYLALWTLVVLSQLVVLFPLYLLEQTLTSASSWMVVVLLLSSILYSQRHFKNTNISIHATQQRKKKDL